MPASVSGQERSPVVSALQITFAANGEVEWCVYVKSQGENNNNNNMH